MLKEKLLRSVTDSDGRVDVISEDTLRDFILESEKLHKLLISHDNTYGGINTHLLYKSVLERKIDALREMFMMNWMVDPVQATKKLDKSFDYLFENYVD